MPTEEAFDTSPGIAERKRKMSKGVHGLCVEYFVVMCQLRFEHVGKRSGNRKGKQSAQQSRKLQRERTCVFRFTKVRVWKAEK